MPWLYFRLKPHQREPIRAWQAELQAQLMALEAIRIGADCFIAPEAQLFAEPHREIVLAEGCTVAAGCFLHGPLELGAGVSLNHRCSLDGGAAGVSIGAGTRIAHDASLYAFDHGFAPERPVAEQAVRSQGIRIGADCWIGAHSGITDGVRIGDHAVIGMGSVVTRDVPDWAVAAGNPARVIGDRRDWRG